MFTPRHPQPFTLREAIGLDVSTITAEIARLQNSLAHLRASNIDLLQYLESEGEDREIRLSVEENEQTISSQEERILILRGALAVKIGPRTDDNHYAPAPLPSLPSSTASGAIAPTPPPGLRPPPGLPAPTITRQQMTTAVEGDDSRSPSTLEGGQHIELAPMEGVQATTTPTTARVEEHDDSDGVYL